MTLPYGQFFVYDGQFCTSFSSVQFVHYIQVQFVQFVQFSSVLVVIYLPSVLVVCVGVFVQFSSHTLIP